MTGRVEGKSIIVTGAGSGMGRAIAHRLAVEGASITVADLDGASAQVLVEEIRVAGGKACLLYTSPSPRDS